MGLIDDAIDIFTRPVDALSVGSLTDPSEEGQSTTDLLIDPLAAFKGLPGIDGTEADSDDSLLENTRRDETEDIKKKAILDKRKAKKESAATGQEAIDNSSSIATQILLG